MSDPSEIFFTSKCECNYTPMQGEIYVCVVTEPGSILNYIVPDTSSSKVHLFTYGGHLHIPHGTRINIGNRRYMAVAYYISDQQKDLLARANGALVAKRLVTKSIFENNSRTMTAPDRVIIPSNTQVWIIPGTKLQSINSSDRIEIKESVIATID